MKIEDIARDIGLIEDEPKIYKRASVKDDVYNEIMNYLDEARATFSKEAMIHWPTAMGTVGTIMAPAFIARPIKDISNVLSKKFSRVVAAKVPAIDLANSMNAGTYARRAFSPTLKEINTGTPGLFRKGKYILQNKGFGHNPASFYKRDLEQELLKIRADMISRNIPEPIVDNYLVRASKEMLGPKLKFSTNQLKEIVKRVEKNPAYGSMTADQLLAEASKLKGERRAEWIKKHKSLLEGAGAGVLGGLALRGGSGDRDSKGARVYF